jgi:hypothetical protein
MGLGMEGDDFYYWKLKTMRRGWSRKKMAEFLFSTRALRVLSKGRNADFRTHQVPYQVILYFAGPFTTPSKKKIRNRPVGAGILN